jgi:hypothetical protein
MECSTPNCSNEAKFEIKHLTNGTHYTYCEKCNLLFMRGYYYPELKQDKTFLPKPEGALL